MSLKSESIKGHLWTRKDILVAELVHGDGCMFGIGVTDICVAIILWNEVHIMEEETVPVFLPHGLTKSCIHQLGPVKRVVPSLQQRQASCDFMSHYCPHHLSHLKISESEKQIDPLQKPAFRHVKSYSVRQKNQHPTLGCYTFWLIITLNPCFRVITMTENDTREWSYLICQWLCQMCWVIPKSSQLCKVQSKTGAVTLHILIFSREISMWNWMKVLTILLCRNWKPKWMPECECLGECINTWGKEAQLSSTCKSEESPLGGSPHQSLNCKEHYKPNELQRCCPYSTTSCFHHIWNVYEIKSTIFVQSLIFP